MSLLVWPWLLGAPGWLVATRIFGLRPRSFAAPVLAAATGIALGTLVHLPAILVAGRPTLAGIVVSGVVASAACVGFARYRARARPAARPASPAATSDATRALRDVPWPPWWFLVLVAAWAVARVVTPWSVGGKDGPYLFGMVRSLATSFPPVHPAACLRRLDQPWGYWMLDALALAGSGDDGERVLAVASAVYGVVFLALAYVVVTVFTRDRRAGALTLPVYIGGWEALWIVRSLGAGHFVPAFAARGDHVTFATNLWLATYDVPTLILFLLLLLAGAVASLPALVAVLVVFPFFHPASALIAAAIATGWLLYEAGARRVSAFAVGLVPAAFVPFLLLYVRLYAPGVEARSPFLFARGVLVDVFVDLHGTALAGALGLALPLVVAGLLVPRVRLQPRALLLLGVLVPLLLDLLSRNIADNYHWTYDPLVVIAGVVVCATLAAAWRSFPRSGLALLVVWLGLAAVGMQPWQARDAFTTPAAPVDDARAAELLRARTPPGACLLAPADDERISRLALVLAQRSLLLEQRFHLDRTVPRPDLDALARTNAELVADPAAAARSPIAPTFAVFVGDAGDDSAWRARGEPTFTSGDVRLYEVGLAEK